MYKLTQNFKDRLLAFVAKNSYPQIVFANAIKKHIPQPKIDVDDTKIIVDIPCGKGETSYHLSKIKNTIVHGYDIDEVSIGKAKTFLQNDNLTFKYFDIRQISDLGMRVNIFCIINSLFLLPSPSKILKIIHDKLPSGGLLFVIIPNIESTNYKIFSKSYSTDMNQLLLRKSEIEPYFHDFGFKTELVKGIAFSNVYGWKRSRYLVLFYPFFLRLLSQILSVLPTFKPNYFLIKLEKG